MKGDGMKDSQDGVVAVPDVVTTTQRFTAEVYLNLPDGIVILSPAWSTPDGTPRYRIVATSEVSAEDALDKLVQAGFQITLDVQA